MKKEKDWKYIKKKAKKKKNYKKINIKVLNKKTFRNVISKRDKQELNPFFKNIFIHNKS